MINIHKQYLIKKFLKKIFLSSGIFLVLILIINLIEEANFLKETDSNFLIPILLSSLNAPSLLYEMFPFIFLISTQFFFIEVYENKEIYTLKQFGMDNFMLLRLLTTTSFIMGFFIIIIFYNFSSILKNEYLKIKNDYAKDKKYLAVITKNGLWIKDNQNDGVMIINADKIENQYLINSSITRLDSSFVISQNIIANKIDVTNKEWVLYEAIITEPDNKSKKLEKTKLKTNFDLERISNLFSDLSALTYFDLIKLEKDYKAIGYSISEINIQKHRFYSLPFLLAIMTIIATIIMIYNKFKHKILFNLFVGILISVIVYYLSHFTNLLGENGKLPLILSVWFPVIMLLSLSIVGIIKLNEK
jgi:lipopolysaccharide export system permease protein